MAVNIQCLLSKTVSLLQVSNMLLSVEAADSSRFDKVVRVCLVPFVHNDLIRLVPEDNYITCQDVFLALGKSFKNFYLVNDLLVLDFLLVVHGSQNLLKNPSLNPPHIALPKRLDTSRTRSVVDES